MNTFVASFPYRSNPKRYSVAIYVDARNCRAHQFKRITGPLTFYDATEQASHIARSAQTLSQARDVSPLALS